MDQFPPSVNWHFWPWCNYGCKFCFAVFEDIPRSQTLDRDQALQVPAMLAAAGAEKLTFVGGEPTLCPYLADLLGAARDAGLVTSLVTNASLLTESFLTSFADLIDWVGISIDSSNDDLHADIGRGRRSDLGRGVSTHLTDSIRAWRLCEDYGIQMKLNTVVTSINQDDDMTELVLSLKPRRWKVFQMLPVAGQNDEHFESLEIRADRFDSWVQRHRIVETYGIPLVAEPNSLMRGSYAMMDSLGRFYDSTAGCHTYGPSALEVGVAAAWDAVSFQEDRFIAREGIYNWNAADIPRSTGPIKYALSDPSAVPGDQLVQIGKRRDL